MIRQQVVEGTSEEIATLLQHEYAGLQLGIFIQPAHDDLSESLPEPPNSVHSIEHLESLLLEGIAGGPATPMTRTDWDDITKQVKQKPSLAALLNA